MYTSKFQKRHGVHTNTPKYIKIHHHHRVPRQESPVAVSKKETSVHIIIIYSLYSPPFGARAQTPYRKSQNFRGHSECIPNSDPMGFLQIYCTVTTEIYYGFTTSCLTANGPL